MSKRDTALAKIRAEYAKHGEATLASVTAYCENRISRDAHDKAAREGMAIYRHNYKIGGKQ